MTKIRTKRSVRKNSSAIRAEISAAHNAQPGFTELVNEYSKKKEVLEAAIRQLKQKEGVERIKIFRSSVIGSILYGFCRIFSIFDLRGMPGDMPLLPIAWVILIVGWATSLKIVFFVTITVVVICAISTALAPVLENRLELKFKNLLESSTQIFRDEEVKMRSALADWYGLRCQGFAGYPPDWEVRRRQVMARDHARCQSASINCSPLLHVHHIIPLKNGGRNNFSNLVTLCARCHELEHERLAKNELDRNDEYLF